MNKFLISLEPTNAVESLLQEIFHGFHVVISGLLYRFHPLCIGFSKVAIEVAQGLKLIAVNALQLWNAPFAQGNEILYFHAHPIAYQCIFRKIIGKFLAFVSITSIDRRNGSQ